MQILSYNPNQFIPDENSIPVNIKIFFPEIDNSTFSDYIFNKNYNLGTIPTSNILEGFYNASYHGQLLQWKVQNKYIKHLLYSMTEKNPLLSNMKIVIDYLNKPYFNGVCYGIASFAKYCLENQIPIQNQSLENLYEYVIGHQLYANVNHILEKNEKLTNKTSLLNIRREFYQNSYPIICLYNKGSVEPGHAVLGINYKLINNIFELNVWDSNFPSILRKLRINSITGKIHNADKSGYGYELGDQTTTYKHIIVLNKTDITVNAMGNAFNNIIKILS